MCVCVCSIDGAGQYYVGSDCSNNVAEYFGLIAGLKRFRETDHYTDHLCIEGDSELVIYQLNGTYSVRSPRLRPLHRNADRRENEEADQLARNAVEEESDWSIDYY